MEENNHIVQHNSQQDVEESSSINLQLIYKTLVLNWQWFVLSVIVCLGLAFCYLRYATPIYQASVKLLIKDDDSQTSRSGKSALMTSSTLEAPESPSANPVNGAMKNDVKKSSMTFPFLRWESVWLERLVVRPAGPPRRGCARFAWSFTCAWNEPF